MPPTKFPFRLGLIAAALLASIDDASALGLGELRTRSHLGERLIAEVEVLTSGKEVLDAGCFRLRAPLDEGGLPWLKDGNFNLRRGSPAVLEIRSNQPVREPALQVGLMVACGHEVQRDYTLLFSPRGSEPQPLRPEASAPIVQAAPPRRVAPAPAVAEAPPPAFSKAPAPLRR